MAVRLTLSGTHQGEFQGIPATGRRISYVSHEFYRVENGLFAEEWICSDMASLFFATELTRSTTSEAAMRLIRRILGRVWRSV